MHASYKHPGFHVFTALLLVLLLGLLGSCKKTIMGPDPVVSMEISGRITLNGAGFQVDIYLSGTLSRKMASAADGTFRFTNLPDGEYLITPSKQGHVFNPSNYEILIRKTDANFTAQIATCGTGKNAIMADFSARDQDNNNRSLYDYFGKVILVNFSANWCGPCRQEASHLADFYALYKDKGFHILTILIDGDNAEWAKNYSLLFPVFDDTLKSLWNIYGGGSIPINIILDRNCTIRYKMVGYREQELAALIEKHL